MARTWKIDIDDFLNRSRPRRHGQDTIGKFDGFFDVVGNEQDRFLLTLPNPNEIVPPFQLLPARWRKFRMSLRKLRKSPLSR